MARARKPVVPQEVSAPEVTETEVAQVSTGPCSIIVVSSMTGERKVILDHELASHVNAGWHEA